MRRLKGTKGFTLVELIVVVTILGVLSGVAAPALVGYIDKAQTQSMEMECAQLVKAAQVLATERYGKGNPVGDESPLNDLGFYQEVAELGEMPEGGNIDSMSFTTSLLTRLQYTRNGTTVVYENGVYTLGVATTEESQLSVGMGPSIYDTRAQETITFSVSEYNPEENLAAQRGNIFWYEGDENYVAGYYYLHESVWIDKNYTFSSLKEAIYSTGGIRPMDPGRGRYFRLIDTEATIQDYNWSDWEELHSTNKNQLNKELREVLKFGQFYYVDLTPNDGIDNPELCMYRGPQESYTYHSYLGDIADPKYWTPASQLK